MQKIRESQFELIRVLAQFFIIVYHIYLFFIYPTTTEPFHKAIWLPLHIGVILFILISGWFGIKSTIKSFAKLIIMMALLYFPLQLIWYNQTDSLTYKNILIIPFFITRSPFWFMRTYVYLFLMAPLLNFYMEKVSLRKKVYLLTVLFFISFYAGTCGSDISLTEGKNVITFSFIYLLGRMMREYQDTIKKKIKSKLLLIVYILYNVALVCVFACPGIPYYNSLYNRIFFSYCSIGLLINASMLFILLSRLKFRSKFVNIVGGGEFDNVYGTFCQCYTIWCNWSNCRYIFGKLFIQFW